MAREDHAREGAQAALGDDQILDVAVVMPRGSTFAGVLGAGAGIAVGSASGNTTAWGVTGGILGQRVASASKGSFPSIVLAVSATRLYVLGRSKTGLVGGWKELHPVAYIERTNLVVAHHHSGTVRVLELSDTSTGTTLEFEIQNIGGLGLKDLLARLED